MKPSHLFLVTILNVLVFFSAGVYFERCYNSIEEPKEELVEKIDTVKFYRERNLNYFKALTKMQEFIDSIDSKRPSTLTTTEIAKLRLIPDRFNLNSNIFDNSSYSKIDNLKKTIEEVPNFELTRNEMVRSGVVILNTENAGN